MPDQLIFQRRESKYLLTDRQARGLLASLSDHLTPDRYSHSAIRSIYYDTPDFRLIRRSMERPVYKEKLRLRSYGCPGPEDTVFAELKKKYRSVVYKRRVALPLAWAEAGLARRRALPDSQIGRELTYALDLYPGLAPAVFLAYERDAFHGLGPEAEVRVTFDRDIRWRREALSLSAGGWGRAILPPDQVLMEVKTPGGMPLWLTHALTDQRAYRTSFSKYGSAYQVMLAEERKGVHPYA